MTRRLLPLLVMTVLAAGCGSATTMGATPGEEDTGRPGDNGGVDLDTPPPVEIAYDGGSASLEPWTFCYAGGCADGAPPEEPHFVGSPTEVRVSYPLDRWTFSADFTPAGERCGRHQHVELERGPDGGFVVHPAGPAGTYDVTLAGALRGEGDLYTTFRWETPKPGEMPDPSARAAVLADHDGELDSYGVELDVGNLAATPREATATIEVRDETGRTVTLEPRRRRGCLPEGTVSWRLPDRAAREATALTGDSFTYRVTVTLDGTEHVATATWPGEEMPDLGPSVPLEFTPPLPALGR